MGTLRPTTICTNTTCGLNWKPSILKLSIEENRVAKPREPNAPNGIANINPKMPNSKTRTKYIQVT